MGHAWSHKPVTSSAGRSTRPDGNSPFCFCRSTIGGGRPKPQAWLLRGVEGRLIAMYLGLIRDAIYRKGTPRTTTLL